ncbi:phage tail tube protein [Bradyrhizobium sp. CAR08]
MTSANRTQVSAVRESTLGVTPTTPRMRKMRITGESLQFSPTYVDSDEIRDDRMLGDPIKTNQVSSGGVNFELSYPDDLSPLSEMIMSAFENAWVNTPQFFNDGTADSIITDAGTVASTYAVSAGGAAVKLGHLVRATGFTQAANNQIFRSSASTGTTVVGGAGLVAEVAPPGTAKLKVIGFAGVAGDITALADGLGSTALDFTTLGLVVGQWVKVGGSAAGNTFAFLIAAGTKARAAAYARITAIAAQKLTLDNLPSSWATDVGTGKTIWVFFGDQIKNGVTKNSLTIEKGFLAQPVPSYIVNNGMCVNTFSVDLTSGDKIKGTVAFTGMGGGISTTTLDAVPDAVTTGVVMAANANVGRLGVNQVQLGAPNWAKGFTLQINNNLRSRDAVDSDAPVDIADGECTVTGKLTTYFGSSAEVQAFYDGTPRQINSRVTKNGQTLILQAPRAVYRGGGNPQATAKNTDVMADFDWQAAQDVATNAHVLLDRFEYVE